MALSYHKDVEKNRRMLSYGSNEGLNSVYELKRNTLWRKHASEQPLNNILTASPTAAVGERKLS